MRSESRQLTRVYTRECCVIEFSEASIDSVVDRSTLPHAIGYEVEIDFLK